MNCTVQTVIVDIKCQIPPPNTFHPYPYSSYSSHTTHPPFTLLPSSTFLPAPLIRLPPLHRHSPQTQQLRDDSRSLRASRVDVTGRGERLILKGNTSHPQQVWVGRLAFQNPYSSVCVWVELECFILYHQNCHLEGQCVKTHTHTHTHTHTDRRTGILKYHFRSKLSLRLVC